MKKNLSLGIVTGLATFFAVKSIFNNLNAYSVKGEVILITGSSRGLGLVLARQLVLKGAKVAICARDEDELQQAASQLKKLNGQVSTHVCDVANRQSVETMVREVISRWGKIDVLINNAGIIQVGPMETMEVKQYEDALNINFWGAFNTTFALLPYMRERRKGRIVNITSIGGKISIPHLIPYSVSKFAFIGFSQGLHAELKKDNIVVTTVCPGLMRTGSHHNIQVLGKKKKEFGWFSILGTSPLFSISEERAATSIINAFCKGKAEIVLSMPAKLAMAAHGVFPGLSTEIAGLITQIMPEPKGKKGETKKGHESHSSYAPSVLTQLGETSAKKNNEL